MIGFLGTAIGALGGIILGLILDRYQLIRVPGDIYFIETVPVMLRTVDILAVSVVAVAICLVATIYPAWQASRLVPVEAIRYE
jgi:lipoprotein-releasing system permease protein